MSSLKERSDASFLRMGVKTLPCSIRSCAHFCIRFTIGGDEDIYLGDHRKPNGAYVENAVDRALCIYSQLPAVPNILRIDDCPGLKIPGLPEPDQQAGNSSYWQISQKPDFLRKLFREIIRAEIDTNGIENLVSNVYFLNDEHDILFHLYDDRGADVAAANAYDLTALKASCAEWILNDT